MKIWLAVTLFLLFHIGTIKSGEKEDDTDHPVHEHHEDTHHTDEMKERKKRVKEKVCSMSPYKGANMDRLKKYDACNLATILFGRTNMRNCFTTYLGFKKRIVLERMYDIYCLSTAQREKEISTAVLKCLTSIAKIAPKEEFTHFMLKVSKLKTAEEKKEFAIKVGEMTIQCEEAALGI